MPVTFYPSFKELTPHAAGQSSTASTLLDIHFNASGSGPKLSQELLHSSLDHAMSNGTVLHQIKCAHHAVSIRPDDVWIAILTQFSFFVNANAEELRDKFVAHQGQKRLEVRAVGTRYTVNFWSMASIDDRADSEECEGSCYMRLEFVPTSLPQLITISQLRLKDTSDDWKLILARIEELRYGSQTTAWLNLLWPVISHFISAFETPEHPDSLANWSTIVSEDHEGSGMDYLGGWPGEELKSRTPKPIFIHRNLVLNGVSYHRVSLKVIPISLAEIVVELKR
ncbi:hypothetical protein BT96DRAFT_995946 [Gymnopus androsaceus JB14]|uniref:Uncharacterized protein n=1 Tax=Gymnopus androsaceus JB14 TaxID=1447944 RepID=A0A6A4HFD8_9AGAR|nr:hypothetical protein BT96DRAFT_995946 [Gymnopus androsaceus JB14]